MDSFPRIMEQKDVLRCEAEINNLWGELNTANIPHATRIDLEKKLSGCEEQFKAVLSGNSPFKELDKKLTEIDHTLAISVIEQAKHELPKGEHLGSTFQALENILHEVNEKKITPVKARHEVKAIMRHRI